jgi:hypothetical protein
MVLCLSGFRTVWICELASQVYKRVRKFAEATISFVVSVRSFAWNNSPPTGQIFMKFDIWLFFENRSRKF